MRAGWKLRLGDGAVRKLLGGRPEEVPKRYDAGSPIELLPTGVKQVLIHGAIDEIVPVSQSEGFVERAKRLGDEPLRSKLEDTGHFELIDTESSAWPTVSRAAFQLLDWGIPRVDRAVCPRSRSRRIRVKRRHGGLRPFGRD